jgi:hypothetical protein
MRSLVLLGALLVLSTVALAEETKKPQLQFQGQTFELAFAQANQFEALNEYIPSGETLEKWNTMLAVRSYAGRRDYQKLAGGIVKALKEKNPLARAALHTSVDGKRSMVDFVTWDLDQEITELNVFIYHLGPDGNSVLSHQFAQRVYGKDDGLEFLRELKDRRMKLLAAVGEFSFPAITK